MKTGFTFIIVFSTFASFAQEFGFKGGLNVTDIVGISPAQSGLKETEARVSYHAGAFFLLPLSDIFKIMPEVVYSKQGAAWMNSTANYGYLNVPIMFNFYASDVVFFQFGPQLGILTSAKVSNGSASIDIKDQMRATDFSFCIGLGVEYNKLLVTTNYNLGFTGIYKSAQQASVTNSVFQLSVGYKILEYEFAPKRRNKSRW